MFLAYGSTVERIPFNAYPPLHRTYHVRQRAHQSATSNLYSKFIKTESNRHAQNYRIKVVKGTGTATVGTPRNVQHILGPPCRVGTQITHREVSHRPIGRQSDQNVTIMRAGGETRRPLPPLDFWKIKF
jgi:hypothetical protein